MLCYEEEKDVRCPIFRCDSCGEVIKDTKTLIGVFDSNNHRILTFHKGACDPGRPGKKGPYKGGWIDGAALIAALCRNYDVDPKEKYIQLDM
jgi:hypothetical protein